MEDEKEESEKVTLLNMKKTSASDAARQDNTNKNNDEVVDKPTIADHETSDQTNKKYSDISLSDNKFKSWLLEELQDVPGRTKYDDIFQKAIQAIIQWRIRYRGNPKLWNRIFRRDKIIKELVETAPIMDAVYKVVNSENEENDNKEKDNSTTKNKSAKRKITIVDLASGKGYLSMFLSEILPPSKVERFVCIDKAWPMHNDSSKELKPTQISREHLGGEYFTSWPIPIHTSKQDLKAGRTKRQLQKILFDRAAATSTTSASGGNDGTAGNNAEGSFIFLAVHLCGTLSIKAVDLFNHFPDHIKFLALKPCCLPGMIHAKRKETFHIGRHAFEASDVCASGTFHKNVWNGPPRGHLEKRFNIWANHLLQGTEVCKFVDDYKNNDDEEKDIVKNLGDSGDGSSKHKSQIHGRKKRHFVSVQKDGGFQNTYIFAERMPLTFDLWNELDRNHQEGESI